MILIIDDSAFQRGLLRQIVLTGGYETVEAIDGADGLAKLRGRRPDCILSDLLMPRMGGLELLEALSLKEVTIPVIIVTANLQESVRERCLAAGAVGVVHKPAEAETLLALIDKTVQEPSGEG
ncbi:MAG: response regulator [Candidatus Marinimicrobia bacterium]|nr:response regulator [Candidatus Neomarinimicrobiota bacterium]